MGDAAEATGGTFFALRIGYFPPDSETVTITVRTIRSRRDRAMKRWIKRVALGLSVTILLITLGFVWDWYATLRAGQKKLDAVIAKLDAEDPGWRLHDLNEARNAKLPPDEKNVAVVVARAWNSPYR
jgi:hypothetical protein